MSRKSVLQKRIEALFSDEPGGTEVTLLNITRISFQAEEQEGRHGGLPLHMLFQGNVGVILLGASLEEDQESFPELPEDLMMAQGGPVARIKRRASNKAKPKGKRKKK